MLSYSAHEYLQANPYYSNALRPSTYNPAPVDDQLNAKIQLRNRLNTGKLSGMPGGFPFRYVFDGHGAALLCLESFEFREELSVSRHRSQIATISFTQHSTSRKNKYLTWRAYLPALDAAHSRVPAKVAVAHVQVDPAVMSTSFWKSIKNDPRVILRALAISLELGVLITITVAGPCTPPLRQKNGPVTPGSVVYISTSNNGEQELMFTAPL